MRGHWSGDGWQGAYVAASRMTSCVIREIGTGIGMGMGRLTEAVNKVFGKPSLIASSDGRVTAEVATSQPAVSSWRRVVLQAAGLWLATRVALVAFTYFAVLFRMGLAGSGAVPLSP